MPPPTTAMRRMPPTGEEGERDERAMVSVGMGSVRAGGGALAPTLTVRPRGFGRPSHGKAPLASGRRFGPARRSASAVLREQGFARAGMRQLLQPPLQ